MLALVDAGVACKGMLVAVAVAVVEGEMRLDPTPREEELATSRFVFAFSFGVDVGGVEGECVGVDSVGQFEEDEVRSSCLLACPVGTDSLALTLHSSSKHKISPRRQRRPSWLSFARA